MQIVEVHELWRNHANWNAHVFIPVEWGAEIKVFDVGTSIARAWCGDDAVPHDFAGSEVGGSGGEFVGVVDQVATCGDSDSVGVGLLWAVVDNDVGICNVAVRWKLDEFDSVGSFGILVALSDATKFDAHRLHPSFT